MQFFQINQSNEYGKLNSINISMSFKTLKTRGFQNIITVSSFTFWSHKYDIIDKLINLDIFIHKIFPN